MKLREIGCFPIPYDGSMNSLTDRLVPGGRAGACRAGIPSRDCVDRVANTVPKLADPIANTLPRRGQPSAPGASFSGIYSEHLKTVLADARVFRLALCGHHVLVGALVGITD